ncbi:hypothetical protein [Micromonospora sp. NBC_01796]|uniref:hypothetical protein n=1 Tax=Micromonospora sp. NBC_01796 TaxID=2975987 RepID=UPI002DDC7DAB|nr:hypothetical protein [Micromonospora sp. NBC_01796]WSA86199.1 hypothetical protein OIE47_00835 [Micromonospora sp. NBC_01796]
MSKRERLSINRFNTYPAASGGQRLTATVVALAGGTLAGLLCAWLAVSLLSGVHWLVQTLAFAIIGLVVGGGLLVLLGRLHVARER